MVTIIKKLRDMNNSEVFEQMIESPEDLKSIEFYCAAGSIAYTAGFGAIYHLDSNGNWIAV